MASYSRKGWILGTAFRLGRDFRECVSCATTGAKIFIPLTEMTVRKMVLDRMNWFGLENPSAQHGARQGEFMWSFRERDPNGQFVGSSIAFLAPSVAAIRRIRTEAVEANKKARVAMVERSEIRRAVAPASRVAPQQSVLIPSRRRL